MRKKFSLTLALLCFGGLPNMVHAAAIACTPQAGYTNCLRYTYSGASQTFAVPAGVTQIKTTVWGAGGGGSMPASGNSAGGAAGGFAEGVVTVTPIASLTVTSGQGGVATGTNRTYGQGGAGGPGRNRDPLVNPQSNGSSGGGMSGVWNGAEFVAGNALIIAGGGGGSAFWTDQPAASRPVAGAGGGLSGVNGTSSFSGLGGSQVAGGAAGLPVASCSPAAGSSAGLQLRGGDGCWPTVAGGIPFQYEGGGGGGGGWFGGGGGVAQNNNNPVTPTSGYAAPGGGGSGYVSASVTGGVLTAGAAPTYTVGSTAQPPQTAHALYGAGIGRGGAATTTQNAAAGNGEVIIQWAQPIIRLQKALPGGRAVAADQFTLTISGANGPASVVTSGAGTTATGIATLSGGTAGTSYTLSEAGASGANLANYMTTYACTNVLAGGQTPSGTGTNFNITPVAGDNLTCTLTNTPVPRLTVTKTASANPLVVGVSGQTYTITINVANRATTNPITLVDILPTGITLSGTPTATGGAMTGCPSTGNTLAGCSIAPGAAVGNIVITVPVAVGASVASSVTNTARAAGGGDPLCTGILSAPACTGSVTTATLYAASVQITKTDNKAIATSGTTNVYVVTLTNQGPSPADGSVLTDTVGAGLTCPAANPVTCTVIAAGAACPGAITVGNLTGTGVTIATLPASGALQFTYTCNVN